MAETDSSGEVDPLLQPRVIRLLRRRPKLFAEDARNEFWEEIENNVIERRKPDTVAERTVDRILNQAREATSPVMKGRARERVRKVNETTLSRL